MWSSWPGGTAGTGCDGEHNQSEDTHGATTLTPNCPGWLLARPAGGCVPSNLHADLAACDQIHYLSLFPWTSSVTLTRLLCVHTQETNSAHLHVFAQHLQWLAVEHRAQVQVDQGTQLQPAATHPTNSRQVHTMLNDARLIKLHSAADAPTSTQLRILCCKVPGATTIDTHYSQVSLSI